MVTWRLGDLAIEPGDGGMVQGPARAGGESGVVPDLESLRAAVRFDERGRYRPLCGARSLPGGWRVVCGSDAALNETIETVYPLAMRHRKGWAAGTLRVVSLQDVLTRQAGRYEVAATLSPAGRLAASQVLCGQCVRVPVWRGDSAGSDEIPCPEACSVLVSLCREAAIWEAAGPDARPVDPDVPFAQFEEPGNEVREAYLATRYGGAPSG
jgi:hypothetical protein